MAVIVLCDVGRDVWVESSRLTPEALGLPLEPAWSVTKRTLRGGRREGVEVIELDNGGLELTVIPTRGMGLWRGRFGADRLGWDSPVRDGPVHPSHVNLAADGGIGWIDGFDELMVRCGLENNGAPYAEAAMQADGAARPVVHPLHGRIANRPAHRVEVHVDERPPHAITVLGVVDESRLFGVQLRLTTRITTVPGTRTATVRDEVENLGDAPADFQLLYHWNFGPPYLGEGSRLVAPLKRIVPRDARAVEGVEEHDLYGPPEPGFAEQCYFYELYGAGEEGRTLTLLRDREGERAVALRFATAELPCFTLWKNTGGLKDGYVTGLEPATNYPNPRPFEAARGRVVRLAPGESRVMEITMEVASTAEQVSEIEREVARIVGDREFLLEKRPVEPFAPAD